MAQMHLAGFLIPFRLNGKKLFSTGAIVSDLLFTIAVPDDLPSAQDGWVWILIPLVYHLSNVGNYALNNEKAFRDYIAPRFKERTDATMILDPGWWDSVPKLKVSPLF